MFADPTASSSLVSTTKLRKPTAADPPPFADLGPARNALRDPQDGFSNLSQRIMAHALPSPRPLRLGRCRCYTRSRRRQVSGQARRSIGAAEAVGKGRGCSRGGRGSSAGDAGGGTGEGGLSICSRRSSSALTSTRFRLRRTPSSAGQPPSTSLASRNVCPKIWPSKSRTPSSTLSKRRLTRSTRSSMDYKALALLLASWHGEGGYRRSWWIGWWHAH